MFDIIKRWFGLSDSSSGGSDSSEGTDSSIDDPLGRTKEEHLAKKAEANRELTRLREERDELKAKREELKEKYKQAKAEGDEEKARDYDRDYEEVTNRLATTKARIDETSEQRNVASNLANLHDAKSSHEDEYWAQLKAMDEAEVREKYAQQEMDTGELLDSLRQAREGGEHFVGNYADKARRTTGTSSIESDIEEDIETSQDDSISNEDVVDPVETNPSAEESDKEDDDISMT